MFPYIQVFGRTIGMYGLCIVIGVLLAVFLSARYYKSLGQPSEDIYIVGACCLGAAMVFGNFLYIAVTYPFSYIWSQIRAGDFSFLGSGIVFYGGLIGGVAGALFGVRLAKCRWDYLIEAVVPYVPLGHGIGRIGCFMAGCCYGIEYNGSFAVHYPKSLLGVPQEQGYFPVQPLEAILNVGICSVLLILRKRLKQKNCLLFLYFSMYALIRFGLEFLRGDLHRGIFRGLSLSQWISLLLFAVGLCGIFILRNRQFRNNK